MCVEGGLELQFIRIIILHVLRHILVSPKDQLLEFRKDKFLFFEFTSTSYDVVMILSKFPNFQNFDLILILGLGVEEEGNEL